MRASSRTAAA
jgi:hypothetical protein